VEFAELLKQRRMVRAFDGNPIAPDVLERVLDAARRAPSAGNSQGWGFVVLEGADTNRFWDVTLPAERRASFRFPQLLAASAIVLPLADKRAYLARYAEPDKAHTGLSEESRWPVPYWQIDTAFAAMLLLLAAEDEGLGALFFGVFRDGERLLSELGVPEHLELIGAIALGHRADGDEIAGRSADRERRPLEQLVHRGAW
jgi:nitroreductase